MAAVQPCMASIHPDVWVGWGQPFDLEWHLSKHTERLQLTLRSDEQAAMLTAVLSQLQGLTELRMEDERQSFSFGTQPPLLPGLEQLPALRLVMCTGSVPAEVWRCPHLIHLDIVGASQQAACPPAPSLGVSFTALRELRLARCLPATQTAVMRAIGPAAASLHCVRAWAPPPLPQQLQASRL